MAPATSNPSLAPETMAVVEELDRFAARPEVMAALQRARMQAEQRLRREPSLRAASAALEPSSLGWTAADKVGSIRVSVTRDADGDGIERHVNSTQYLLALGTPVHTHVQTADGWRIDCYGQGDSAALQDRWHVVPPGLWHKTVAPGASFWGIVAFHSAREVSDEYR